LSTARGRPTWELRLPGFPNALNCSRNTEHTRSLVLVLPTLPVMPITLVRSSFLYEAASAWSALTVEVTESSANLRSGPQH
jgi:hypothetical protein